MEPLNTPYPIVPAAEADRQELLALSKAQLGREQCPWDEGYPSHKTLDWDLARDALFLLREGGRITAAISIESDEEADHLPCWDPALAPAGELARLAVLPAEQNRGLGKVMLQFGLDELKRRGSRGVRILVNRNNEKAIRCYAGFGFRTVGECRLYEQDFFCYEREL